MTNKEKLLNEAAISMAIKGYHPVTMDALLQSTGIAKSNAYYHYSSKELLGLDVLRYFDRVFRQLDQLTLINAVLSFQARFEQYTARLLSFEQSTDFSGHPLIHIATDVNSDDGKKIVEDYLAFHNQSWEMLLQKSSLSDQNAKIDKERFASIIPQLIIGGLAETRLQKNIGPIKKVLADIRLMIS